MPPEPSIGRIVHYVSYGTPGGEYKPACRAAIVTEVDSKDPTRVGLCVLNPTGQFFHSLSAGGCTQYEGGPSGTSEAVAPSYRGGSWHWPERVA